MSYITCHRAGENYYFKKRDHIPQSSNCSRPKTKTYNSDRLDEYLARSDKLAIQNFQMLALANFQKFDKFITLTIDPKKAKFDPTDLSKMNQHRNNWLKKIRATYSHLIPGGSSNLKHLTMVEHQKNGNIHFHIFLNITPMIDLSQFKQLWIHGDADLRTIGDVTKSSNYMLKTINYLLKKYSAYKDDLSSQCMNHQESNSCKDSFDVSRSLPVGSRRYYSSNNLVRPVRLSDDDALALYQSLAFSSNKPFMDYKYFGYGGEIIHCQAYHLSDIKLSQKQKYITMLGEDVDGNKLKIPILNYRGSPHLATIQNNKKSGGKIPEHSQLDLVAF